MLSCGQQNLNWSYILYNLSNAQIYSFCDFFKDTLYNAGSMSCLIFLEYNDPIEVFIVKFFITFLPFYFEFSQSLDSVSHYYLG